MGNTGRTVLGHRPWHAQLINFGVSHLLVIPIAIFPKFPASACWLAFPYSSEGSPECLSVPFSAIGDTISCDAPYSAIQRPAFLAIPPLLGLSSDCNRPFFTERSGGVAAIVCDATGNTVRQGYCYTCLAMGGLFWSGH